MLEQHIPRKIIDIVEDRVQEWKQVPHSEKKQRRKPLLLISREAGTMAEEVALRLSKELDMHLYDDELISRIAEDAHTSETLVRSLDEKGTSFVENLLEGFIEPEMTSSKYANSLYRILGTVDWHGNSIILGRGAAFYLRGRNNLLVRFVAPIEDRVRNLTNDKGMTEQEARRLIEETDKGRRSFVHKYFRADIDDAKRFDLVINSATMNVETATQVLKTALSLCCNASGQPGR
jgi:hypothetical protein